MWRGNAPVIAAVDDRRRLVVVVGRLAELRDWRVLVKVVLVGEIG